MTFIRRTSVALSVLVPLALCFAAGLGCGSGSPTNSSPVGTAEATSGSTSPEGKTGKGQEEPGAEFSVPGGKNEEINRIIAGTKEATVEEREAASDVLKENFEARAIRDWSGQCRTLSKGMVEVVEENSPLIAPDENCAEHLAFAGERASRTALVNTMEGSISALRLVGGGQAFALYHGIEGKNYLIPMERESGDWKAAALTAKEIPGS